MKAMILLFLFLALLGRPAQAQSDFIRERQSQLFQGATQGSAYDTYARLIAAHIAQKHVPGNPVSLFNVPGGGSMVAANYVYGVAKRGVHRLD